MRQRINNTLDLQFQTSFSMENDENQRHTKIVRDTDGFYKRVNAFLQNNPQIVEAVHKDLMAYAKEKF